MLIPQAFGQSIRWCDLSNARRVQFTTGLSVFSTVHTWAVTWQCVYMHEVICMECEHDASYRNSSQGAPCFSRPLTFYKTEAALSTSANRLAIARMQLCQEPARTPVHSVSAHAVVFPCRSYSATRFNSVHALPDDLESLKTIFK